MLIFDEVDLFLMARRVFGLNINIDDQGTFNSANLCKSCNARYLEPQIFKIKISNLLHIEGYILTYSALSGCATTTEIYLPTSSSLSLAANTSNMLFTSSEFLFNPML